ncbi:MAG: twin-arginine translocation signal domain-containing protein [Terracidiphilus sp.]|nr:twin-arginine translocation signal domain-containing protein [Terracidiphilus sp.]MDR3776207.1 twin-arginine translocation signal domain-containing protein [Terracidiphilus sp.]
MLKKSHLSHSRRDFMTATASAGGAILLGPAWLHVAGDARDNFLRRLTAIDVQLKKGHIRVVRHLQLLHMQDDRV